MAQRNLYLVLGVPEDASSAAIRAAFRERAKRYHPDLAGPLGADAFRNLTEAYAVLSDPRRRVAHDLALSEQGLDVRVGSGQRRGWESEMPVEPLSVVRALRDAPLGLAEEIDDWTARHVSHVGVRKSGRRHPLVLEVFLTPWEAERGAALPIRVPTVELCEACRGSGGLWLFTCSACGGGGAVRGAILLAVEVPPGLSQSRIYEVALDPLGLELRVVLRVAGET